jgi:hypothetical protein
MSETSARPRPSFIQSKPRCNCLRLTAFRHKSRVLDSQNLQPSILRNLSTTPTNKQTNYKPPRDPTTFAAKMSFVGGQLIHYLKVQLGLLTPSAGPFEKLPVELIEIIAQLCSHSALPVAISADALFPDVFRKHPEPRRGSGDCSQHAYHHREAPRYDLDMG